MLSFRYSLGSAIHNNKITLPKTCTEIHIFALENKSMVRLLIRFENQVDF